MAMFKDAIDKVLKNEGGFNDIPQDKGSATNYGISLRFYQSKIDSNATKDTIKNLTRQDAEDIYFQYFWHNNKYDEIKAQVLAEKLLDISVNMGNTIANRFCQKAYNALGLKKLEVDGIMGSNTIDELNKCSQENIINMISYIKIFQKNYYLEIVSNRPDQHIFLKGWLNRADN